MQSLFWYTVHRYRIPWYDTKVSYQEGAKQIVMLTSELPTIQLHILRHNKPETESADKLNKFKGQSIKVYRAVNIQT